MVVELLQSNLKGEAKHKQRMTPGSEWDDAGSYGAGKFNPSQWDKLFH